MLIFNQPLYKGNILSFTSEVLKLDNMLGYCIQIIMTGNPTGTLSLEGSDDSVQIAGNPVNWNLIANSTVAVYTSDTVTYNVRDAYYNWVRVVYIDGSGGTAIGTASITGNAKGART